MTQLTDIVYFYKKGPNGNSELSLSIASARKHFTDLGDIYVIGDHPGFEGVTWIDFPSAVAQTSKDVNLLNKMIYISQEEGLSDKFVMCSDDHFFLKDTCTDDLFPYYEALDEEVKLKPFNKCNTWNKRMRYTTKTLEASGYPGHNFDSHIPHLVEKELVRECLRVPFNLGGSGYGMCVFSVYFNVNPPKRLNKVYSKVRFDGRRSQLTEAAVTNGLEHARFALVNDASFRKNKFLKQQIEERFKNGMQ